MTRRKPPGQTWKSWIDRQIEKARADGAFENLPGEGKPLTDMEEVYDPGWWAKKLVQREQISMLPPALEIRRNVERAMEDIGTRDDEKQVREKLEALNAEIARANARVTTGPPTQIGPLDIEAIIEAWRTLARSRGVLGPGSSVSRPQGDP
jgi:hypothetical protein